MKNRGQEMKKYVNILKNNGLKVTPQRLEILKYLDENQTHPTVDIIYKDLKEKNPSLSLTTVYNNLETLKNNKIILELSISRSESRYDFKTDSHHHSFCKRCGRIKDISVACPFLDNMLTHNNTGFQVEEVHGYFKGVCGKCAGIEVKQEE